MVIDMSIAIPTVRSCLFGTAGNTLKSARAQSRTIQEGIEKKEEI